MKKCPQDFGERFKDFNEICDCELKPKHVKGEHDWCCQICGGNHTERICPLNK